MSNNLFAIIELSKQNQILHGILSGKEPSFSRTRKSICASLFQRQRDKESNHCLCGSIKHEIQ